MKFFTQMKIMIFALSSFLLFSACELIPESDKNPEITRDKEVSEPIFAKVDLNTPVPENQETASNEDLPRMVVTEGDSKTLVVQENPKDITPPPGKYDAFAECVSGSGAIVYGTSWCSHCQAQRDLFENSVSKLSFVDCDQDSEACKEFGITSYPTWIFGDGTRRLGTQPLENLAEATGCELLVI